MHELLNPGTLIFLIPLAAIIGSFIVKLRKMEIERSGGVNHDELRALRDEIVSLRRRMEHVEAIVASDESELKSEAPISDNVGSPQDQTSSDNSRLRNMLH